LISGSIRFLETDGDVLAFVRQQAGERLLCVFNFTADPVEWTLPDDLGHVESIDLPIDTAGVLQEAVLMLPALGGFLGRIS
ncbi:alpha-glucosidase, partial [bacterium M00.F.Ca.ET.194.01.1.1]